MADLDAQAGRLAERQHGVFSRTQAMALGFTADMIKTRVRAGRWRAETRAVYRLVGTSRSWPSPAMAAVLGGGEGALASHRSAARLWGLRGRWPERIEITVPRGHKPRHLEAVLHESTDLELAEPTTRFGIPVTGIARTLLDLGASVSWRLVEETVDAAVARGTVSWPALYGTLVRHSRRGRDGCGPFRAVLDERFGDRAVPDSRWERMVARLLVDAGLRRPVMQHPVIDDAGITWSIDLAYPDERVGIELQSRAFHLNASAFEQDKRKLNRLRLAGWTMLEYTWRFFVDRPDELCDQVALALRANCVS